MEEARWNKIETIFNGAISLPEGERNRFVERNCLPDLDLYEEVISLINAETLESAFLNSNAFTLGAKAISDCKLPETDIFADYKLIKLLGRGGMGIVFLAEDTRLKRLVAVKLLTSALWESKDSESRFRQEAQAASHVSHQNIAHVYEYGEYEGQHFLAMEYVRGQTLREIIKEGSADHEKTIDIVTQILEAVSAAHRQGIIHRDIKPENIIISEDGLVKVLDFGLAKQTTPRSNRDTSQITILETTPGIIVGTAGYMSPEQVRGQSTDERTDLWSVGVVLYELLAGVRPFTGDTSGDVHASILRDDPPVDRKWPKSLQNILKKALQKDPSKRFQTATEFSQKLRLMASYIGDFGKSPRNWSIRKTFIRASVALLIIGMMGGLIFISLKISPWFKRRVSVSLPKRAVPIQQVGKISSLVILPFSTKGDSAETKELTRISYEWSESLTNGIGSTNACLVKSSNSAFKMKDVTDIGFIRDRLSVDTVLRGMLTKKPNKIRIEVELINALSKGVLWRDDFEMDDSRLLAIRERLFSLISANLQGFLPRESHLYPSFPITKNEKAYVLYLRGRYYYVDPQEDGKKAYANIKEALEEDYEFHLAHLAMAEMVRNGLGEGDERVETYAAVPEIDNLSRPHILQGEKYLENRMWPMAFWECQHAREANPNDAEVSYWYGASLLPYAGRFDEALAELETALEIDPLSEKYDISVAKIKLLKEDYEGAIESCDKFIEKFPQSPIGYSCKIIPLAKLGRREEADKAAGKGNDDYYYDYNTMSAMICALTGKTDLAHVNLESLERQRNEFGQTLSPYRLATIYAIIGDKENALKNLKEATQSKDKPQLLFLRFESAFDGMRNDPEFVEIEKRFTITENINLEL